jgi:hypothetical protein
MLHLPRWLARFAVRAFPRYYRRSQRPIRRHGLPLLRFRFVPRVEECEGREAPGSNVGVFGFGAAGVVGAAGAAQLLIDAPAQLSGHPIITSKSDVPWDLQRQLAV